MSDKKAPEKAQEKAEEKAQKTETKTESSGYVGWGEVGVRPGKNGSGDGDKKTLPYLKLEEGSKPYRIRLVHKPYRFFSHFDVIRAISPGLDNDVCWQAGNSPRERYAILVLDRNDENKLKILEAGPAVFNEFKAYFELSGKDPGAVDGPDWLVQVKIPVTVKDGRSFKDKRKTKYHVMKDEKSSFTEEEKQYIKDNWVELSKMKSPTSPEMIKEMFGDAKVRGDKDPVPGSHEWWLARREKRQAAAGATEEAPLVPPENTEPEVAAAEAVEGDGTQKAGFNGLFEEDGGDGGKKETGF